MIWVVVKRGDGGWEEIVSNEFRLPTHAHDCAERMSRESLGAEFSVCNLVREKTYCSRIVTTTSGGG